MLTDREMECAKLAHLSNAQIAKQIGIAEGTVKVHFRNASRKFKVHNRLDLQARVIEYAEPETCV